MSRLCLLAALITVSLSAIPTSGQATPCFSDISAGLTGVEGCAVAWADYDNDGDLDLLTTGLAAYPDLENVTRLYRNSGGPTPTFTDIGIGLPGTQESAVAWGDYDNDGDLDLLISGYGCTPTTRIYRNSGGANPYFNNAYAALPGLLDGGVAWGDYDNDGDLDIALCGRDISYVEKTLVFRSSGGANPTFTDAGAGLLGLMRGMVSWADYDQDGDLDLLVTGYNGGFGIGERVILYDNNGGSPPTLAEGPSPSNFATDNSDADWGDYDNDGDLDLVMTGSVSGSEDADVYRQSAGHFFSDIHSALVGVEGGSARWGDYNNDGRLDVLLVGQDGSDNARSLIQQAPTFTDIGAGLAGVGSNGGSMSGSGAAWADYDNDGDLDVALSGRNPGLDLISRMYRNDCGTANTPPAAPSGLTASVNENQVTFSWSASTDAQTPSLGLTYNLRVGTTSGGSEIVSPAANPASGYRRIPAIGNTNQRTSWTIRVPNSLALYWSVQAIDGSYAGSPFAAEQSTFVTAIGETEMQGALLRIEGPNPLSKAVTIAFNPPEAGHVRINVYDIAGRLVRTLLDAESLAGPGAKVWDGRDDVGVEVPAGLYLIRLHTNSAEMTQKVTVVR